MHRTSAPTSPAALWQYNAVLLTQAIAMVERLLAQARPGFVYARAVGPHLRHIVEHYQAVLTALPTASRCVDYDARDRDLRMQSEPEATLGALRQTITQLSICAEDAGHTLAMPLATRLQAGLSGELEATVPTTLGRELLFLASHTVHHYALLGHYCREAGVDLGPDFGKAPATIAFEQAKPAVSA